jgi:hypothetical protein
MFCLVSRCELIAQDKPCRRARGRLEMPFVLFQPPSTLVTVLLAQHWPWLKFIGSSMLHCLTMAIK